MHNTQNTAVTSAVHHPTCVCAAQCLELDFRKPQAQQIAARMAMVCRQEGLDTNEATLRTLIEGGQGDLRLVLGQLQVSGRLAGRAGPAVCLPGWCCGPSGVSRWYPMHDM
jgi:hypothetical protein